MPPFTQNGAISASLKVTETIKILQPLVNIFDKEINTNAYLAIIYEKIWYFSELKTCLFHLLKHVFFGRKHGKQNSISCGLNDFFLIF